MFVVPNPALLVRKPIVVPRLPLLVNGADASSYTFPGVNIGPASFDRVVVAAFGARATDSRTITSVLIGGIAAIPAQDTGSGHKAAIYYALVPSGTTADVTVNFSGGMVRCALAVWTITGVPGLTAVTQAGSDSGNPSSVTVTVPADGVTIAAGFITTSAGGGNATLSGVGTDFSGQVESAANYFSAGSATAGNPGGVLGVSCAWGGTINERSLAVAVFR